MTPFPSITGSQLIRALRQFGFETLRVKGSHHLRYAVVRNNCLLSETLQHTARRRGSPASPSPFYNPDAERLCMRYLLISLCLCCFACASHPYASSDPFASPDQKEQWLRNKPALTPALFGDYDCGELPANYQHQIKNHFDCVLIDPMSAVYEFNGSEPYAYYPNTHMGVQPMRGIGVFVSVNAKNRMGGYVGRNFYLAFFHDGTLRYVAKYLTSLKETYDITTARP